MAGSAIQRKEHYEIATKMQAVSTMTWELGSNAPVNFLKALLFYVYTNLCLEKTTLWSWMVF
jgi:hypothetical protein